MPAPVRLQVGAVGERDLDLHEHVARAGPRVGDVLEAQVAGAVEARALTGRTPPSAPPGGETGRAPRRTARAAARAAPAGRARAAATPLRASRGRRRARADDGQLPPVDRLRGQRPRVGEERAPCRPARRPRAPSRRRLPRRGRPRRPARRARGPRGAGSASTANTVVAAPLEHRAEEPADEAVADDEHASARHPLDAAQHAGERLDHRRLRVVDAVRNRRRPRSRAPAPRSPPGTIVGSAKLLARRLVPGAAARARAARPVMDQRLASRRRAHDDLVPEHRARGRAADLLDVRAAEPAREHLERRVRRGWPPRRAAAAQLRRGRPRASDVS